MVVGIDILLAYRGIHVLLLAFAPSGPQPPQNTKIEEMYSFPEASRESAGNSDSDRDVSNPYPRSRCRGAVCVRQHQRLSWCSAGTVGSKRRVSQPHVEKTYNTASQIVSLNGPASCEASNKVPPHPEPAFALPIDPFQLAPTRI